MGKKKSSYRSTKHTRKGAITAFGSRTDVGCVRDHNEDSLVVSPPLFAVADGMGGHAAGEVASEIAVDVLSNAALEHPNGQELANAIVRANAEIIEAARCGRGREGMGCTLTACVLEGEKLVIGQVGDSRAYLMHNGKLSQVTRDHSLMADMIEAGKLTEEEARVHPQRSVITRALGTDISTQPDIFDIDVTGGDKLLVCSDGLTSMVKDADIERVMQQNNDPQRCASKLVNEAISAGGADNVTVIVVNIAGTIEKKNRKMARKTKRAVVLVFLLLALILGGVAYGVTKWLNTTAYLSVDNGKVAVYKGKPWEILGYSLSQHVETTSIEASKLQPNTQSHLEEGISFDNVDAAYDVVESYRSEVEGQKQSSNNNEQSSSNSSSQSSSSQGDASQNNSSQAGENSSAESSQS